MILFHFLLLPIGLCLVGFGPPALRGTDDPSSLVYASTLAEARRAVPPIQASAAAVVAGDSGELVWGKNPHQPLPPASMTKMMTALVAIQRGNLDRIITSDVDAATMTDDSVMGLHPGEQLSLHDLLYGLMLPSGNDAALVIATAVGGNEADFVAAMNAQAAELGLTDTHFVNPHGLDANGHLASPYDEIMIARAAMRLPLFRQVVSTKHIVVRGKWTYDLTNTNALLGARPEVVGVKTGTTDLALHCITVAAEIDGRLLYLTVMHTPDYRPDVISLLDYFEEHQTWVSFTLPSSPLYQSPPSGPAGVLASDGSLDRYLPRWEASTMTTHIDLTPDAPLRATDNPDLPPANAGAVTYYAAGAPIARFPLR